MRRLSRNARRMLLAVSAATMLSGCNPSAAPPIRPNLPPASPDFGRPVPVPTPKVGQDARLFAGQNRKAVIEANQRLRNDAAFYRDVQEQFGQGDGAK